MVSLKTQKRLASEVLKCGKKPKGNQFKNRTVLIEVIFKEKTKKVDTKKLEDQREARRHKNLDIRKNRAEKRQRP